MSWPTATRSGRVAAAAQVPQHARERRGHPVGDVVVDLIGIDAADVIGLEDSGETAVKRDLLERVAELAPITGGPPRSGGGQTSIQRFLQCYHGRGRLLCLQKRELEPEWRANHSQVLD